MIEAAETEKCTPSATFPYFLNSSLNRAVAIDVWRKVDLIAVKMEVCSSSSKARVFFVLFRVLDFPTSNESD